MVLDIGAAVYLGNKTGFGLEVKFCEELLDGVNCNGLVYGTAGTCVLAAAVTNAAADCRERILPLDKLQGLLVLSKGCLAEISLNSDMGRAGGLTGRSTCIVAVDAVLVTVILRPVLGTPRQGIRKRVLGIIYGAVLGAEFLAKFHGTGGAIFNAAAAGNALFRLYLRHIGASAHVGRIEEL